MKSLHEGQLVTVTENGESVDGIVFQVQSVLKAVVAVPDTEHGAAFRTVHRATLAERGAGEHDDALKKVIRRTNSGGRSAASGGVQGSRGFGKATGHRKVGPGS